MTKFAQNNLHDLSTEEMKRLLPAADAIRDAMPISLSIDNYLDAHRDNAEKLLIGKMAIAHCILEGERRSNIFGPDPSNIYNKLNKTKSETTWINAFFRKCSEGIDREHVEQLFDNLAIVTFNYDRCIEHFLFHAVRDYYELDNALAARIVGSLPLIHAYGKSGRLPWQNGPEPVAEFGKLKQQDFVEMAKHISTFTEADFAQDSVKQIQTALTHTETLVFLGSSFQQQNLALLPEGSETSMFRPKSILATTVGMSNANRSAIQEVLRKQFMPEANIEPNAIVLDENRHAESFIDDYWRALS